MTTTMTIYYVIDKASKGIDFFVWGTDREAALLTISSLERDGFDADEFQIGEAVVPADYDGEFVPEPHDRLAEEYANWIESQGLPEGDAMEHLMGNPDLTPAQRKWLQSFVARWNAVDH